MKGNLGEAALALVTYDTRIIDNSFTVCKLENGILVPVQAAQKGLRIDNPQ